MGTASSSSSSSSSEGVEPTNTKLNMLLPSGDTLLTAAVKQGYADLVLNLLLEGASVDQVTRTGASALHLAVRHGHGDIVDTLLEYHADVNTVGNLGMTPLHIAAQYSDRAMALTLLKAGANPDAKPPESHQHHRNMKLEKQRGKVPSPNSVPVLSPLSRALENDNIEVAYVILEYGANVDYIWTDYIDGIMSLTISESLSECDLSAFRLVLAAKGWIGVDEMTTFQKLFYFTSIKGQTDAASVIYQCGYQPTSTDLRTIGAVMDSGTWEEKLLPTLPKPSEDVVRKFKLWLYQAVNYPRSLAQAAALVWRRGVRNNVFFATTRLGIQDENITLYH